MPGDGSGRAHLRALAAAPRPAGSEAERRAREHCAATLRALGYDVTEEPFEYSDVPGRWGTAGSGVVVLSVLPAVAHLARAGAREGAAALIAVTLAGLALGGFWLARRGVLALPAGRRRGINLVARPVEAGVTHPPAVWLLAHLDSKSQPVPMLARAVGITATALVWLAAIALLAADFADAPGADTRRTLWPWLATFGVLAALPVAGSVVGERSPGALDDASGVASVLEAAAMMPPASRVGVLLTSAEELGLAGARAWVARRGAEERVPVLNCDGVDDDGGLVTMHSGRRPARLLAAAERVAAAGAPRARAMRLLPGVLVDAVAFADAGWETMTVSRGTMRTLLRVHRTHDDLAHLRGDGIDEAARLLAALGTELARDARKER